MKFSKVHRIVKFKRSYWLREFVYFNTDKRKNASNNFEKHFFKLMINSVFGFSILELNKSLMYEFHCKYIKNKFDAKLLFTDADSLVYEIKTKNIYEDFYLDKDLFDLSDYPLHSKFFDPVNKKVIGKMKNEFKGKIITEFAGLKSKMYILTNVDNEEVTKAKGVNKKVRQRIC